MRIRIRRIISFLLVFTLIAGVWPQRDDGLRAEAAVSRVSLSNMGSIGTLSVGSKTKSGSWWKMYIGGNELFCLNLGATCHTGDAYQSDSAKYSSNDSGKKGLEACIGYWYDAVKKGSNRAYIIAQALFWAVEEGEKTEAKLKAVIKTMKNNTGYYDNQSVSELYSQIFEPSSVVTINVNLWKYTGSGSKRQVLMDVVSTSQRDPKPKHLNSKGKYRQRITLQKLDEDENPVPKVTFRLWADNIDELYYFKANGWGDMDSGDVEEDADHFELETMTDAKGQIAYCFNYHIQSEDYYYYDESELKNMSSAELKKAKKDLEEEGYRFGSDLSEEMARDLSERDIVEQIKNIENHYNLQEISTGDDNLFLDSEIKKITVRGENSWQQLDGQWPDTLTGTFRDYPSAYRKVITNRYKKVCLTVRKKDSKSSDGKAHGDASLDGAQFQLYSDAACTKEAYVFNAKGERFRAGKYVISGGKLTTNYLQGGKTYYLKELQAPKGYKQSNRVLEIHPDVRKYTIEYSDAGEQYEVVNEPILGKIAVQKYSTDGTTGPLASEEGAEFQVYLKSAKSYEMADEYERDTIKTNREGYACTKDLYYGTYIVHQVSSGNLDTELAEDFEMVIDDEHRTEPYRVVLNNKPFKAYLKVIKKDGNTSKEVLKSGTTYQIYEVDSKTGKEKLVKQSYSDGNSTKVVDQFSTDDTGRIMTVNALPSGTYRIYETDTAHGLHISTKYIEVTINSRAGNCVVEKDSENNIYTTVTLDYINDETCGRLSIMKKGEQLKDFENGAFVYEETYLKGAVFEIYADEDIETQDNQGTKWFDQDELVGTVTTGTGAVFTSECGGITTYEMDEHGTVTVQLPLGKYRVVEKQTLYGFVLPEKNMWEIEFTWENKEDKFVLNATENTDENGVLAVKNQRAKAALSLVKTDSENSTPVSGAVFELYSSHDIYNADGEKIAEKDDVLGSVTTDREGKADFDLDLPLRSENYTEEDPEVTGLNSGDYYIQEKQAPSSYLASDKRYPVHLEYQDADTPLVASLVKAEDAPTTVEIDKLSVTGSGEIPGCHLQITDQEQKTILSWVSGDEKSITLNEDMAGQGYENVRAEVDQRGNLVVRGLLKDQAYTLTETRPADGYVTADSITFMPVEEKTEEGSSTRVDIKQPDGSFAAGEDNVVHMIDDQTKIQFYKYGEDQEGFLEGAEIAVYDQDGKQVTVFITKSGQAEELTGILAVGRTYIFRELEAPEGYKKAEDIQFMVQDTPEVQIINMKDLRAEIMPGKDIPRSSVEHKDTEDKVPKTGRAGTQPQTGADDDIRLLVVLLMISGVITGSIVWYKRRTTAIEKGSAEQ